MLMVVLGVDDGRVGPITLVWSLIWGSLTLYAAWSWVLGRWRIVIAPVLTVIALFVAFVILTQR